MFETAGPERRVSVAAYHRRSAAAVSKLEPQLGLLSASKVISIPVASSATAGKMGGFGGFGGFGGDGGSAGGGGTAGGGDGGGKTTVSPTFQSVSEAPESHRPSEVVASSGLACAE